MRSILVGLCNIFSHPPSLGWGLTKGKSSRGFDSQSWIKEEEKILKSTKSALLPLVNTLILKLFPGPNHSLRPAKPREELNRLCSTGSGRAHQVSIQNFPTWADPVRTCSPDLSESVRRLTRLANSVSLGAFRRWHRIFLDFVFTQGCRPSPCNTVQRKIWDPGMVGISVKGRVTFLSIFFLELKLY